LITFVLNNKKALKIRAFQCGRWDLNEFVPKKHDRKGLFSTSSSSVTNLQLKFIVLF